MFRFTNKKSEKNVSAKSEKANISAKLDMIITEIKDIKKDIVDIKADIVVMKADIVVMKADIVKIKGDLTDLQNNFTKYKKQDANFQEARTNNFIISLLRLNKNTYTTKLLPIKNVYTPYSKKALTEFDGLILYTPNATSMPSISSELASRVNKDFQRSLKNNLQQINTLFTNPQLIVVESKRSISKEKIDKKIMQFYELIDMMEQINTINMETVTDQFRTFYNELLEHSELSSGDIGQLDLKMIFGSDDITDAMKDYIIAINNGITKSQYNYLCDSMFNEDSYAHEHIKKLRKLSLSKIVKEELKDYSFESLKEVLHEHFPNYMEGYIGPYFVPFDERRHAFERMKGRIGIVQFTPFNI
jgi:hypothetical protein